MANRIDQALAEARASGKTALAPFVTVGFPDVEKSEAIAAAIVDAGADLIELGIPFSDPLAEGVTIQKTSFQALQQGVNVHTCLDVVRRLRERVVEAPLIFMGYFNPYLHYGLTEFVRDAARAGVDGLIVPDLPTEEAGPFQEMCDDNNLYLIPLLAPTSTDERIAQACKRANGFIYCVSLTGITGARADLSVGLAELVGRIRRHTDLPILVGFGVSTRDHVEAIGQFADGALMGSALLDAVDKAPSDRAAQTAGEFVKGLLGHSG